VTTKWNHKNKAFNQSGLQVSHLPLVRQTNTDRPCPKLVHGGHNGGACEHTLK